jgi:16S rRNA (guanine(966)-N(2))-methyltransferase RsmD
MAEEVKMRILSGKYRFKQIQTLPSNGVTRPTMGRLREAFFNMVQFEMEGARILDLFAGSGSIGCEALSRGAKHVSFVEKDLMALGVIKQNLQTLNNPVEGIVIELDLLENIEKLKEHLCGAYDLVYFDPPYHLYETHGVQLNRILDFLRKEELLSQEARIFCESDQKLGLEGLAQDRWKLHKLNKYGKSYLAEYRLIQDGKRCS